MKFCKNCGTELLDTAAFCPKCGTAAVVENAAPNQAAPTNPDATQAPDYQAPNYQTPNYNQAPNYQAPNYSQQYQPGQNYGNQQNNYYQPQQQNNYYQPQQQVNYYQPAQNVNNYAEEPVADVPVGKSVKALVFGVLSLCFFYVPILGIIFANIARSTGAAILSMNPRGAARGLAKAGRITGTVGLPLSIVYTVIIGLYILMFMFMFIGLA